MVNELEQYGRNGDERGRVTAAGQEESDRKLEAMANTPDSGRTLAGRSRIGSSSARRSRR